MHREPHDTTPPPNWTDSTTYLIKSRLSPKFPLTLVPYLFYQPRPGSRNTNSQTKYDPLPISFSNFLSIRKISDPTHPACGQNGLFTKKRIGPDELIIPYLGVIHASFLKVFEPEPESPPEPESEKKNQTGNSTNDSKHESIESELKSGYEQEHESDYDLSLVKISAYDPQNPIRGSHISIGVDAAHMGNAARFVNDYRGVQTSGPNAEFRLGVGEKGEKRMEIWSLGGGSANKGFKGIAKGEEILVSYGKGWWGARKGG